MSLATDIAVIKGSQLAAGDSGTSFLPHDGVFQLLAASLINVIIINQPGQTRKTEKKRIPAADPCQEFAAEHRAGLSSAQLGSAGTIFRSWLARSLGGSLHTTTPPAADGARAGQGWSVGWSWQMAEHGP